MPRIAHCSQWLTDGRLNPVCPPYQGAVTPGGRDHHIFKPVYTRWTLCRADVSRVQGLASIPAKAAVLLLVRLQSSCSTHPPCMAAVWLPLLGTHGYSVHSGCGGLTTRPGAMHWLSPCASLQSRRWDIGSMLDRGRSGASSAGQLWEGVAPACVVCRDCPPHYWPWIRLMTQVAVAGISHRIPAKQYIDSMLAQCWDSCPNIAPI